MDHIIHTVANAGCLLPDKIFSHAIVQPTEKLETLKSKLDRKAHNLKLPDVSPASDKLKVSVRRGKLNRLTHPE